MNSVGVVTDLNHIDTPGKVSGYLPENGGLRKALTGADVVVIPAGTYCTVKSRGDVRIK